MDPDEIFSRTFTRLLNNFQFVHAFQSNSFGMPGDQWLESLHLLFQLQWMALQPKDHIPNEEGTK